MRINLSWLCALTFSFICMANVSADEMAGFVPGKDKSMHWTRKDINACWAEYKPILLYVYDVIPRKSNPVAYRFEKDVFTDVILQKTLDEFNCVMIEDTNTTWPDALRAPGHNGAAVYVMTCDAKPVQTWTHYNNSTANEIQAAVEQAKALNGKVIPELKRAPPRPYTAPNIPNSQPPSTSNTAGGFAPPPTAPSVARPEKENTVPGLTMSNEKKPATVPTNAAKGTLAPPPTAPKVAAPDSVPPEKKKTLADEE